MALYPLNSFNQSFYLTQYPDVVQAIANGSIPSALWHYEMFGEIEGRMPSPGFNPAYYAANNPDVLAAVGNGSLPGFLYHYENWGVYEGRQPAAGDGFNNAWYVANNPDVAAAIAAGSFVNGWQHYALFGAQEGRAPDDPSTGPVQTYVLTTGLDKATANQFFGSQTQFIVDGHGPTLNAGDQLTGVSGVTNNTLTITDLTPAGNLGNIPAGVVLTNIQNVVLSSSGNTTGAGTGFSTAPYADVRSLVGSTNGGANDIFTATNGANGTVVTVNHNGFTGNTTVVGGTDVTATSVGGNITIGSPNIGRVPLASEITTGAIVVNQYHTAGGTVSVFGGTTVAVNVTSTTNTGAINIGNTAVNTGNNSAGAIANASGNVTVNTAGTGAVTIHGGADVVVNNTALSGAGAITVGDVLYRAPSNLPGGNVTIVETAQIGYNGLPGSTNNNVVSGAINVFGGHDISITTNAANLINIGNLGAAKENALNPTGTITVTNTGVVSAVAGATGAVNITGGTEVSVTTTGANVTIGRAANAVIDQASNPTGNVTVTQTMNGAGANRAITIEGGADVTVTAKGQSVTIGDLASSAPTGAVLVNQADVFTGRGIWLNGTNAGNVTVFGGTTVTVNTTGGNVTVGGVVGSTNTVPSDAVSITRTLSGPGIDTTTVAGGTTVAIATGKTTGAIAIGNNSDVLTVDGTALKDAILAPTGNVSIVNATIATGQTAYGTGTVNVRTNGATAVSTQGGNVQRVIDIQSTLATGGPNAGKAVGVSTLAGVVIDGLQGTSAARVIQSDALTAFSLLNTNKTANTFTLTNNTAAHALTITQGNNAGTNTTLGVVDAKAGSVTITDNGVASTANLRVDAAAATAATINNAAAATIQLGGVSTNIAKVTLTGAGATTLGSNAAGVATALDLFGAGNLSKALVIDASAATGAVTASMQATTTAGVTQQYLGGKGLDTLTINSNVATWGNAVKIDGGDGAADVLVANYAAAATDTALGSNPAVIKNFEVLRLGANATSAAGNYDATGFSGVEVGSFSNNTQVGVAGNLSVTNAGVGANLSVLANTGGATIGFAGTNRAGTADALTVNLGTSGSSAQAPGAVINGTAANGGVTGAITATGVEALTVNAVGGYVSTAAATSLNIATINGTPSAGVASLAVTGDRSLTLTSNYGFTSVNASGNTGATVNVSAAAASNIGTTFTGGASKLTAVGSNDSATFKSLVTLSGTPGWVAGDTAVVTISTAAATVTYTYTGILTTSAANVAALLGEAITTNAGVANANGAVVRVGGLNTTGIATASGGNIVLSRPTAFQLATSDTAAGGTIGDSILGGQQQVTVSAGSAVAAAGAGNLVVTFAGGAAPINVALANNDTQAQIATKVAAAITAAAAADKPQVASAQVSALDPNNVVITTVSGQITAVTVTDGTVGFVGGGMASANSYNMATANNAFVTGAGGGDYKLGLGGSWNTVSHAFSSGSESVALAASAAKTDTIQVKQGAVATFNGTAGGVTGFVVDSQSASDQITFRNAADNNTQNKTILANHALDTVTNVTGAAAMANVFDTSGALFTKLGNLTYSISNGVITFSATGGHSLAEFNANELQRAAEILVSSITTGGGNQVAAFSSEGHSYVIASDAANTLAGGVNDRNAIIDLKDVPSVMGFGTTFGQATVVSPTVLNRTNAAVDITLLAPSSTLDYTGFAIATLAVTNGTAAANTNSTTFNNLAASAQLVVSGTAGNGHVGSLTTNQVGASGHNSLTVTMGNPATTIDSLTVNGDALVVIQPTNANLQTVTKLVDGTNTLNTVKMTGAGAVTLGQVTGTALTTIDATDAGGTFIFGSAGTVDTHDNLTVKLAANQNATIFASGLNDTFTQTANGVGNVTLTASGSNDTITLADGNNVITANGAGVKITVGMGTNNITASGAGDTISIASGAGSTTATVGSNAVVNIGTLNVANAGPETIAVGNAVTGGTSASYALTTINFVNAANVDPATENHVLDFTKVGVAAWTTVGGAAGAVTPFDQAQVNVASATTLAEALDLVANNTLMTLAQGNDPALQTIAANSAKLDWMWFGGDTYVVAMVNDTNIAVQQTALDSNDIVVKITGLVDLSGSNFDTTTADLTI